MRSRLCSAVVATLLALAPALPALAQGSDKPPDQLRTLTRDELDVIKVLTQQERAWNKGDIDTFASGYKNSPDILFVGTQVSRGFDHMLADYKKNYATKDAMGALSYLDLEPHVLDEHFAVVVGRYHLERAKKFGGTSEGLFSLVLEKTPEGWKIIVDHTT